LSHEEDHQRREAREDGAGQRDDAGDHHFHQVVEPIVGPGEVTLKPPIDRVETSTDFVELSIDFVEPSIDLDRPVSGPLFDPIEAFVALRSARSKRSSTLSANSSSRPSDHSPIRPSLSTISAMGAG
jgi:hypothetical protein